jgi:ribosomal protein L11 methyltransferase
MSGWQELLIEVGPDDAEPWSDALLEAGALSVQAEDADAESPDEQPMYGEPGMPAAAASHMRPMSLNCEPSIGSGHSCRLAANQVRQGSSGERSRAWPSRSSGLSKGPCSRT